MLYIYCQRNTTTLEPSYFVLAPDGKLLLSSIRYPIQFYGEQDLINHFSDRRDSTVLASFEEFQQLLYIHKRQ